MGQVTIYLEDALEAKMRVAAQSVALSKSRWIANVIREKLRDEWPVAVMDLAGAWDDLPLVDGIREPLGREPLGTDVERESF